MRLSDKFPELTPIQGAPTLFTINGIGTGIYGARDRDDETGTYVTTLCICVIFIPLVALSAYRVADGGNNQYYFLGKQPLSAFAKAWNALLALVVVSLLGSWGAISWYNRPDAVAARELAAADNQALDGQHSAALASYEKLASGSTAQTPIARERLQAWLQQPPPDSSPQDQQLAWRAAVRLMRSGRWNQSADELAARGIALAQSLVETAPDTALELLDEAAGILADPEALAAERRGVLERLQAAKPQDVAIAVRLAAALADEGTIDRAVALLQPLQDKLADTEGARILGQHYAAQGDFAAAYELLAPYCQTRLASYREAEQAFEAQLKATHTRAIQNLQNGAADEAFYRRYESASEAEQNEMVDHYLMEEMQEDVQIPLARERLIREGRIVPVALDFGVVQLERAQSLADPAARQAELTQAEQTFLAVGGAVGETDEYQLNLGKVYYWLGKQEEGRKLFDEILARNAASAEIKLAVAQTMRVVGAEQEARELAEQIFAGETNEEFRNGAARLRSVLSTDAADEVAWLEKVTSTDADQRASLASAKARQAMAAGRDVEAARFLRESAAIYASLPDNSSTLNNAAIAYSALFSIEGKREDLAQAADRMTRAVGMMPDNSILMVNAADLLLQQAVADTIADKLDPRVAILFGKLPAISLCYDNEAERKIIQQSLEAHPALAKARQFYERAMLLAPRRADNYEYAADLANLLDDEAALARIASRIASRIAETPPDTRLAIEEQKKYERGERDTEMRERQIPRRSCATGRWRARCKWPQLQNWGWYTSTAQGMSTRSSNSRRKPTRCARVPPPAGC
jgi:hypothetical protein